MSNRVSPSSTPNNSELDLKAKKSSQDVIAWIIGMVFIIFIIGMSWVWGNAAGWYALSGYTYVNNTDGGIRFMEEPFGCNDTSIPGRSGTDCTSNWYFWKLPYDDITVLSRAIVWLLYSLHQVFVWALIYKAQLEMSPYYGNSDKLKKTPKYSGKIRWFNIALLLVNGLFHILHLVQTHWTYDGLAQDVAINSSQASVILLISLIMLIEYRDRGAFFMWPNARSSDKFSKAVRLNPKPINLVRKYHGYYFAWSIIYTFWYHPFENTWAHSFGFFHTAIVMLQGSLIYTDMHLNKYWRLLNECWVTFHATVVAVQTADPSKEDQLWPMFFFGFGLMLFLTQIYILPFWKKISPYFRVIPPIIYFGATFAIYGAALVGGIGKIYEILFIPSLQYLNMFLAWLLIYFFLWIEDKIDGEKSQHPPKAGASVLWVSGVLITYTLLVLTSHFFRNVPIPFLILMEVFALIFLVGACVTYMFHKKLLGPFRRAKDTSSPSQAAYRNPSVSEGESEVASGTDDKL